MERNKWNENWKVWKETNAFSLVFSIPQDAENVTLPYDALFFQEQNPDSVNEGKTGFMDGGVYNYCKEAFFPEEEKGKDILLLIEGSAVKTWVFVNGSLAGECNYPYIQFYVNLSPWLRYGEVNQIRIVANSLDLSSRFYVGGGIFRDVYLLKGDKVFFAPDSMRITTQFLCGEGARILFESTIANKNPYSLTGRLRFSVTDSVGQGIFSVEYPILLPAGKDYHFSKELFIDQITPWDEHHPALYSCTSTFLDAEGRILDEDSQKTGFRTISVDAENGLCINGEEVKLLGCCIHHDQGILGAATFDSYEYRRIRKLKEAGFNAVRSAHNPASRALLRACDELGVYLLDEAFDMWGQMKNTADFSMFFTKDYKDVLKTMVEVDYNHPSVIMYSTGNEIMDIASDKGYEWSNEMTWLLHGLDHTRPVTNGINALLSAGNRLYQIAADICGQDAASLMKGDVNQVMSEHAVSIEQIVSHPLIDEILEHLDGTMDVIGYNYLTDRYAEDCQTYPQRIILGTETHAKRIGDNWRLMQENKAVIGDFIWTGYSYLGETGGRDRFPALHNESCDLDMVGAPRPTSYYRQIVLGQRSRPYIAVRTPKQSMLPLHTGDWSLTDAIPSWDFPGEEGRETDIEVYSNGDEVELFLNEVSLGRRKTGEELPCRNCYRVPYQPGVLKAVSYREGVPADTFRLRTTGGPVALSAVVEENQPDAELVFVTVKALSCTGEEVYAAIDDLTVTLEDREGSPLTLLAFGSYEAPHKGGYQSPVLSITSGNALAIFRKKGSGKAYIFFSASGLKGTSVEVVY